MTGIKGAIDLLMGGVADEDPALYRELLQIAAENTNRLGALVNDLLDVRKLADGHFPMSIQHCDLKGILQSAVELNQPAAQAGRIRIECRVEVPLPVHVDEGRIRQVVMNLISNALKHTPQGGLVVVSGERIDRRIRVSVIDQGPGVPEQFHDRIFQRFSQADSSTTRSISGTGLGLHIAQKLIEAHQGHLAFKNSEETGAVFYFDLPYIR